LQCLQFGTHDQYHTTPNITKVSFQVGFSSGYLAVYRFGHLNPTVVLTPPSSSRKPVVSIQWSPISPCVLYSVHGHNRLLVWDFSMGFSPLAVNDFSQQVSAKITTTRMWLHKVENATLGGIAFMVGALSFPDYTWD
uniref:WD_REPEATS_REGION domain-containing protein n=1 Tax=Heligmosomoides polygyrus TaxID=6339 RepID=A0A183GVT6_HELPZ